jgi:hypothetical protein
LARGTSVAVVANMMRGMNASLPLDEEQENPIDYEIPPHTD